MPLLDKAKNHYHQLAPHVQQRESANIIVEFIQLNEQIEKFLQELIDLETENFEQSGEYLLPKSMQEKLLELFEKI